MIKAMRLETDEAKRGWILTINFEEEGIPYGFSHQFRKIDGAANIANDLEHLSIVIRQRFPNRTKK